MVIREMADGGGVEVEAGELKNGTFASTLNL
jgi:hypothetical protein